MVINFNPKYIPGDIVYNHNKEIIRITSSYLKGTKLFYYRDGNYGWIREDAIKPIPLTPEILEKNGWDKEEKDGSVFSLSEAFMGGDEDDEDNYTCFQLYYQNKKDGWVIDMRGEPLKFEIHYIHELQHFLFGLGINHEMEV